MTIDPTSRVLVGFFAFWGPCVAHRQPGLVGSVQNLSHIRFRLSGARPGLRRWCWLLGDPSAGPSTDTSLPTIRCRRCGADVRQPGSMPGVRSDWGPVHEAPSAASSPLLSSLRSSAISKRSPMGRHCATARPRPIGGCRSPLRSLGVPPIRRVPSGRHATRQIPSLLRVTDVKKTTPVPGTLGCSPKVAGRTSWTKWGARDRFLGRVFARYRRSREASKRTLVCVSQRRYAAHEDVALATSSSRGQGRALLWWARMIFGPAVAAHGLFVCLLDQRQRAGMGHAVRAPPPDCSAGMDQLVHLGIGPTE